VSQVSIIAEGVPEQHARLIWKAARDRNVLIIGPATVGGVTPGAMALSPRVAFHTCISSLNV
jgi:succinyl-CoA synthetase alpha subunit